MSLENENIVAALRESGDGFKPNPGWQDDVRRTIRNSDSQSRKTKKWAWLRPAIIGGLVTAIPLIAFFLKNQSDNRAEAKAAEVAQAQATASAQKELRALAAASARLAADTKANDEAIKKAWEALVVVEASSSYSPSPYRIGTWNEELSDPVLRKAMQEILTAVEQQENVSKRIANEKSESARTKEQAKLTAANNLIAEKALELLKLKRRMDSHTYHHISARAAAAKNLRSRQAEAKRLSEVRKSQAKAAAKAKRKADKKKFNKCANSSDPLCGL